MAPAPTDASSAPAQTTPAPAQSTPAAARTAPPGYKLIKVKKPDGTIVTVKKKLSPEELEKQQQAVQAQPQAQPPASTDASKTAAVPPPTSPEAKKQDAVQCKIITVRMPDGTLAKVKRPVNKPDSTTTATATTATATATAEKTTSTSTAATTTAAPSELPKPSANAPKDAPASSPPEQPLSPEDKAALEEQALRNKEQRCNRFKTALLFGLVGAADTALPDLLDGDELMSDTDFSDDEDFDEKNDHADQKGLDDPEDKKSPGVGAAVGAAAVSAAAGVAVAAMAAPPAAPPPAQQATQRSGPANGANGDAEKAANGKEAYKVTVKDLKDLDARAEKKEEDKRALERRWAAFSFYFLASLSIILPVLFLILACFIMAMNGKSVDSNWGKIIDPIKIAITVWPIVFAAVTAQGFKTWAAYKVERGVKLMELEQLVGSNSFAAVMKQPFFLRRLDLLTIGIFVIWALSPIGSQALIRSYSLDRSLVHDTVDVKYVPILGNNTLLSPGAEGKLTDGLALADLWQVVATYYMAGSFIPRGVKSESDDTSYAQDMFNHPIPQAEFGGHKEYVSNYGVPLAMPQSALMQAQMKADDALYEKGLTFEEVQKENEKKKTGPDAIEPSESLTFHVISSFFKFTCQPWQTITYGEMSREDSLWSFSISETLGVEFTGGVSSTAIDRVRYATLLNGTTLLKDTTYDRVTEAQPDWAYAMIDCGMKQVFYNGTVVCRINAKAGTYAFDCEMRETNIIPDDRARPEWRTAIEDFSGAFVRTGNPYPLLSPYTPTERYAYVQDTIGGSFEEIDQLSRNPTEFERNFGKLFNTWVTIAHCTECTTLYNLDELNDPAWVDNMRQEHIALYKTPESPDGKAARVHSPLSLVFKLDWRWVAVFLTSVIVLLIVGIASVVLEGMLIAPDVLGYASTLARNSRYLHLPKTAAKPMSGPERARAIGGVKVMIQDVKPDKDVGKIALGLKHDRAEPLKPGRLYR